MDNVDENLDADSVQEVDDLKEPSVQTHRFGGSSSFEIIHNKSQPIKEWKGYLEKCRKNYLKRKTAAKKEQQTVSRYDYAFLKNIGRGSYGKVMLIKKHSSEEYFAAKLLDRERIRDPRHAKRANMEKTVAMAMRFPFIVHVVLSFQDHTYLYFVMNFVEGGTLLKHLTKMGKFSEHIAKFYAAQIIMALEYLHYLDLLYRDLKPENILLDRTGYIKLADFGFCKHVTNRTYTICGTPEYIAPEILLSKGYGKSADYWSFGVVVFELNAGKTPFYAANSKRIFEKIIDGQYEQPENFSEELKDLVKNLLELDTLRRYGILKLGVDQIKNHEWFHEIHWIPLLNKAVRSPCLPQIQNFD